MRIITWLKEFAELIKLVIIIVCLIFAVISVRSCVKIKEEKKNVDTILNSQIENFKTESGKNAVEISQWKVKYKAIEHYSNELSAKNNVYLNDLAKAKQTIKDLDLKLKNVNNYIKNELISKDSAYTELIFLDCDNIEIKPIEKKHIKINFLQVDSFLDVKYEYRATVSTVSYLEAKNRKNGKKHLLLPNAVWLWGYDQKSVTVIDDPNASINNSVSIEFIKK